MSEWLSSLRLRLRAFLQRRQLERDLDDELTFHVEMRAEQLRRSGAGDAEARARRRFGSSLRINQDLRETWALAPRLSVLAGDFRYAARTLRSSPGFACVVILTLGLGIGANTAFFSVVNAVLIRPLGYADADRLVLLHERFSKAALGRLPFSALDFEDFSNYQRSYDRVAAYRNLPFEVSGSGSPERITGTKVTANLFATLGVGPLTGRTFSSEDDRPGLRVVVLSWGLWQRRYGADLEMIGRTLQLDRQPYTVVGIMPPGFVFPRRGPEFNGEPADLWLPMGFTPAERAERANMQNKSVIARLKPGVSFEAAHAELDVLSRRIAANYPPVLLKVGISPLLLGRPLRQEISGRFETPLLMLLAAVGLVLLVACANVANLVLSRATSRAREFAVRTALGARKGHLVRLLLCEALLLAAAGGVVGVTIAYWSVRAAPAVLTRSVPGLQDLAIDIRVLAFTAVTCLATAIIFALAPLPTLDRRNAGDSLRDDPSRTTASGSLRLQRGFVVLTVSLACVLLVGAGLFIRSFATLVATDVGFRPARVLTASMTLPRIAYPTAASVRTFHESLLTKLQALPGVRRAALATDLPLTTYEMRTFTPEGGNLPNGGMLATNLSWVEGPYFEALGMTLSRGRFFAADEHAQNRAVVVINERLAALAWPGQDPVGKRLKWGGGNNGAPWLTVVGVIRNVADGPIGAEPGVHAYEPFRQFSSEFLDAGINQFGRDVKAAILTDGDPGALAASVRSQVAAVDRELAIESIETLDQQVSDVVAPQRMSTLLVGAFAAIALLLASVGLYGLLAYTIAQRRKEIAVRMALGAARQDVVGMVIGQGARLVAIGLVAGLVGALLLIRTVASLLYQSNPYDLVAFAIIPAALVPAAFMACALPAWRAARVEPTTALRVD